MVPDLSGCLPRAGNHLLHVSRPNDHVCCRQFPRGDYSDLGQFV
jgi:hypothetical protein